MDPLQRSSTSPVNPQKLHTSLAIQGQDSSAALKVLSTKWKKRGPSFVDRFKALWSKNYHALKKSINFKKVDLKNPFCFPIAFSKSQTPPLFSDDDWSKLLKDLGQYLGKEAWGLITDNVNFLKSIRDIQNVWAEKSKIYEASEDSLGNPPSISEEDAKNLLTQCQDLKNKLVHTVTNPKQLLTAKVQKNVLARLGWSCMMLLAETLAMVAKLVKLLALVRIPFAYALGESLQGLAHCIRASLQIHIQADGVFAVNRAFSNTAKANKILQKDIVFSARETATSLEEIEKKGILKAIQKQQKSFERFVNLAHKGLGIISTILAATTVTIAVLAATGVVSGMALAVLSPVGWGLGIIGLGVTLTYGSFYLARYFHNYYKQGLWETCLENAQKGPITSDADLTSRGKVYEALYKSAQEKIQSGGMKIENTPEAINAYIQKRALSRLLQLDSSLLLESIYESIAKEENQNDLGEYLSSHAGILSQELVGAIRIAKASPQKYEKAHKPYLMRELMHALAM